MDASAPQVILEAFLEHTDNLPPHTPIILVASNCGVNDRKKEMVMRILDEVIPTVISGRQGDIFVLAQAIREKCE